MTEVLHILPAARQGAAEKPPESTATAWKLFLLLNAMIFMRPAEIVPALAGLPIYNVIIVLCLMSCVPALMRELRGRALALSPVTQCVFGMLLAIVLSLLVTEGDTWNARQYGFEFLKTITYYLLLVSLVNSTRRLRQFLVAVAIFALVLNVVALLSYHHVIDLATVAPMEEKQFQADPAEWDRAIVVRLQAAGIFGNPNDLSRIIVVAITICLFALGGTTSWLRRGAWLICLAVFIYALQLTYSRGGLLALSGGLLVLLFSRYGTRKGIFITLLLLPAWMLFAGRQTDIDTSTGTGQLRIQLWSNGLVAMRSSPIFGIGRDHYFRTAGNHAHNSFVEAYVELGLMGGTLFTGAFFLVITGLGRLKAVELRTRAPELWRLRPYVQALVVGNVVGQFSTSQEYGMLTYMLLGLSVAYLRLAARHLPGSIVRVSGALMGRLMLVSVLVLLFLHLYTKFNAHFGG